MDWASGEDILAIGSDAHKPAHLGGYLREGKEHLKSLGFKQFCTFEGMKPLFHTL